MFTVNMSADLPWSSVFESALDVPDRVTMVLVDLLANSKFITIFSFLFGIGFYLQLERAREKRRPFLITYLRRIGALFLIGSLAIVAGLGAIILVDYAMYGLLLPLVHRRSATFLLASAIVCFAVQAGVSNFDSAREMFGPVPSEGIETLQSSTDSEIAERERVYREGTFLEVAEVRASNLISYVFSLRLRIEDVDLLGLMLLGCYVCRRGALRSARTRREMASSALPWLLGIGIPCTLIAVWFRHFAPIDAPLTALVVDLMWWPFGAALVGLGYAAAITLLVERSKPPGAALLAFSNVGRMALTNYLFHGFVIAFISYQWGLGLYGQMGPFHGVMTTLLVFPLMMLASRWWIERFLFGPFEWLWRTMTYGRMQPLRVSVINNPDA